MLDSMNKIYLDHSKLLIEGLPNADPCMCVFCWGRVSSLHDVMTIDKYYCIQTVFLITKMEQV